MMRNPDVMRRVVRAGLCAAMIGGAAAPVLGQATRIVVNGQPVIMNRGGVVTQQAAAVGGGAGASASLTAPTSPVGQQLAQLELDRSRSSVLKALAELAKPVEPLPEPEPPTGPNGEALEDLEEAVRIELLAAAEAKQAAALTARFVKRFGLVVTAGRWSEMGAMLAEAPDEIDDAERMRMYGVVLQKLGQGLVPGDVVELARAAPTAPPREVIDRLGSMLVAAGRNAATGRALDAMGALGPFFGVADEAARRRTARFYVAAGAARRAAPFLPTLEEARAAEDAEALAIHAAVLASWDPDLDRGESSRRLLEAWSVLDESLRLTAVAVESDGEAAERAALVRDEAIDLKLGLMPRVREIDGGVVDGWLESVFAGESALAWTIIDRQTAKTERLLQNAGMQPDARAESFASQRGVGEIVAASGVEVWRPALEAMTRQFVTEAKRTQQEQRQDRMLFVPADQLFEGLPSETWLGAIDPGLAMNARQLAVWVAARSDEVEDAVGYVEAATEIDREHAGGLADTLLRGWAKAASPNPNPNQFDPYGYGSGVVYFSGGYYNPYGTPPAQAIPLTRARQERNLVVLRDLIPRLEALVPNHDLETAAVGAFATAHSTAEVFSLGDIEAVFGDLESTPPAIGAAIAAKMRTSLGSSWRKSQVQRQAGTQRKKPEIIEQVTAGYELATRLAERAREASPDEWTHASLLGDLSYDHAEFLYGQEVELSRYAELRTRAFRSYADAAALYRSAFEAGSARPTASPFAKWFAAALGASDLAVLTRAQTADASELERLDAAIAAMGDAEREHRGMLADELTGGVERLNPELKPRYTRQANALVGDHPRAKKLRDLSRYYDDLNLETRLVFDVDGSSDVGMEPFGVRVALETSRAVSRESGGFGKYLMNEVWDYTTGAQTNYRDDFERAIRDAYADRFEVQSLVFHEAGTTATPLARSSWESHPLAYMVVSVKDPSVDRLPSVQLDLDFSDGPGKVILPTISGESLISATAAASPRETTDLEIEQVLDARRLDEGVVAVEVIARATGVIPGLDQLLDLSALENGYSVTNTHDHGLSVSELVSNEGPTVARMERSWLLELVPSAGTDEFTFPAAVREAEMKRLRFADADVIEAASVVPLEFAAGGGLGGLLAAVLAVVVIGGAAVVVAVRRSRGAGDERRAPFELPAELTPVSAYAVLRRVEQELPGERSAVRQDLAWIERSFFAEAKPQEATPEQLESRVRSWYERVCAG
ncbi:MAG: hypothetical protein AAGJ54_02710 [Planctomycetota bacterium]